MLAKLCCLFLGVTVMTCAASRATAQAPAVPHVALRVLLDDGICESYLGPGEEKKDFEDQLSAELADKINSDGYWWKFCWVLNGQELSDVELSVSLKEHGANWKIDARFSKGKGVGRISEGLDGRPVFEPGESRVVRRDVLAAKMSAWFERHVMLAENQERLHGLLCQHVPVGIGVLAPTGAADGEFAVHFPHHERPGFESSRYQLSYPGKPPFQAIGLRRGDIIRDAKSVSVIFVHGFDAPPVMEGEEAVVKFVKFCPDPTAMPEPVCVRPRPTGTVGSSLLFAE